MKNIHVLPMDKPSRLVSFERTTNIQGIDKYKTIYQILKDIYPIEQIQQVGYTSNNIYITSDEEIKEDWFIDGKYKQPMKYFGEGSLLLSSRKIILTTDQDLINDGVQAIDDEFLEWFVRNPSCENVEVVLNEISYVVEDNIYKIIIPKEEPKQETLEEALLQIRKTPMTFEPKQETLEEIRNEEMPQDYYPPKDLANAIWGTCFQYKDIETDGIRDKVKNACFMIEKIYKIKELCQK